MLVGLGVALALVIGVAGGQPRVGLGVGSAVAAIGAAMVVSALLSRETDADEQSSAGEPGGPVAAGSPRPSSGDDTPG